MIRRARLLAVGATVLAGAIALIGSTQTWLDVTLAEGAAAPLAVSGASALPVLAPLSLAVLALGAVTSIVGRALRLVLALLSITIAAVLGVLSGQIALAPPTAAVAPAVTAATGLRGSGAVENLVDAIAVTPWPGITTAATAVLAAAGVLTLVTGRHWSGSAGRRFTRAEAAGASSASRPHDAIDSWDDLSRGDDPTA